MQIKTFINTISINIMHVETNMDTNRLYCCPCFSFVFLFFCFFFYHITMVNYTLNITPLGLLSLFTLSFYIVNR